MVNRKSRHPTVSPFGGDTVLGNFFPILSKSKKIWDKKNLAGPCGFLAQARDKEGIYVYYIYIYIVTVYTIYAYYIGKIGIH